MARQHSAMGSHQIRWAGDLMNIVRSDLEVASYEHPRTRRPITTVSFGGWLVQIDGAAVTVPCQEITGKSTDALKECLDAAYVLAEIRLGSMPPVYPPELRAVAAATLRVARRIAEKKWRRRGHDIYCCTSVAWEQTEMAVPYALLIRALRRSLPAGTTLTEYNDHAADVEQICRLYDRGIAQLTSNSRRRGVA